MVLLTPQFLEYSPCWTDICSWTQPCLEFQEGSVCFFSCIKEKKRILKKVKKCNMYPLNSLSFSSLRKIKKVFNVCEIIEIVKISKELETVLTVHPANMASSPDLAVRCHKCNGRGTFYRCSIYYMSSP